MQENYRLVGLVAEMPFTVLKRNCTFCKTPIWWNRSDTTQKSSGSWWEEDQIHDQDVCSQRQENNRVEADYQKGYKNFRGYRY